MTSDDCLQLELELTVTLRDSLLQLIKHLRGINSNGSRERIPLRHLECGDEFIEVQGRIDAWLLLHLKFLKLLEMQSFARFLIATFHLGDNCSPGIAGLDGQLLRFIVVNDRGEVQERCLME